MEFGIVLFDIFSFFEAIFFCDEFPTLGDCLLDFETSGAILDFYPNYENLVKYTICELLLLLN
jgi:hypothetical protein